MVALRINFKELPITKAEIRAATDVLKEGYLSIGPKVAEFEQKFAKYVGAKYAIATNYCTKFSVKNIAFVIIVSYNYYFFRVKNFFRRTK
jgi:hypothetical protein